jgi:hypothetical protein
LDAKISSNINYCLNRTNDIKNILKAAVDHDLMTPGNVWIVCDGVLSERSRVAKQNGLLVAEFVQEADLVYTSLVIIKKVFLKLISTTSFTNPPQNCEESGLQWEAGTRAYE